MESNTPLSRGQQPPSPRALDFRKYKTPLLDSGRHTSLKSKEFKYDARKVATASVKCLVLLCDVFGYFTPTRLDQVVIPLIQSSGIMSMRRINYFVVTYAKEFNVCIEQPDGSFVNVYQSYRNWLQINRRTKFDAFRRGSVVSFVYRKVEYKTTVGQLNYIYWVDTHNVLQYIIDHHQNIVDHMEARLKECSKLKEVGKKKRARISREPVSPCIILKQPKLELST